MPVASKGIVITEARAVIRQDCEISRYGVLFARRERPEYSCPFYWQSI